jgi:hypothetical protein
MLVARLRRFLEGWLVMMKASRAAVACISATMMLTGAASIARADEVLPIDDPLHG